MELYKVVFLGIIQGLTEFLPVSSSGHIILAEKLLGIDGGLTLSLFLHFGTLASVVVFTFKKLKYYFRKSELIKLMIATVPAGVIGLVLSDLLDAVFFGGRFIYICFFFTAIELFVADLYGKRKQGNLPINNARSLYLGLAQGLAVVPAISRSGTVYSAGVFLKIEKESLAEFTFVMSIPVIAGGCAYEILKGVVKGFNIGVSVGSVAVGMLSAFASGIVALVFTNKVFKKGNLRWFSVYLIILSAVLMITGV